MARVPKETQEKHGYLILEVDCNQSSSRILILYIRVIIRIVVGLVDFFHIFFLSFRFFISFRINISISIVSRRV